MRHYGFWAWFLGSSEAHYSSHVTFSWENLKIIMMSNWDRQTSTSRMFHATGIKRINKMNKIKSFVKNAKCGSGNRRRYIFLRYGHFRHNGRGDCINLFPKTDRTICGEWKSDPSGVWCGNSSGSVDPTATPVPIQITNWRIFVTPKEIQSGDVRAWVGLRRRVIFTRDQPQITTDGSVVRLELPEIFWASQYGYDRFKVLDTWVNHVFTQQGPQIFVLTGCEVQLINMVGYGVYVEKWSTVF